MAEKESGKKWLVLLVILVALSLVVDLLSLSAWYDIENSGALEGELRSYTPGGELGQSAITSRISPRKDACVSYCTNDCGIYWDTWYNNCVATCQTRYESGELTYKQLRTCKNSCSTMKWSDSECSAYCASYTGGNPDTGVCCYQDWVITNGSFQCIYYF